MRQDDPVGVVEDEQVAQVRQLSGGAGLVGEWADDEQASLLYGLTVSGGEALGERASAYLDDGRTVVEHVPDIAFYGAVKAGYDAGVESPCLLRPLVGFEDRCAGQATGGQKSSFGLIK